MRPWNKTSNETPWNPKKQILRFTDIYHSTRWRKLRAKHLREFPLCQLCKQPERGTLVDHIKAIQDGGEAWDENNLQTLCKRCHAVKTNQEINNRRKLNHK